jgi:acyl transferase domain-containing protein/3-hydroxymyristoyl/3-hydroxydecanoyl-(acyl carrier protein) dehydratase
MDLEAVAIVGRSCLFPGASTPEELWNLVAGGQDVITHCPDARWRAPKSKILSEKGKHSGRAYTDRGGYVRDFSTFFDPRGFAVDPEEILRHDEFVHWILYCAREALSDARIDVPLDTPARTGAIFGFLCVPTEKFAAFSESVWLGQAHDPICRFNSGLPAHLLARALGLDRGAFALDAACASSLYAVHLACQELASGRADLMLAGAVSRADDLFLHVGFGTLEALSSTGLSRPFHKDADGLLPSEGASFVVLQRLSDAIRDGRRIYGLIRGIGIANDGRSASLITPSESGQERAIRAAYEIAGVEPPAISLIECHATGTPVGDACEIRSTGRVFDGLRDVPIGSLKSNLGHPMTAAGMAGLLKLLGALAHGIRPATLHIRQREDENGLIHSSPFRLLRKNEAWETEAPRKAALSGFGFGGNNAHVILEEWVGQSVAHRIHPQRQPGTSVAIVGMGIIAGDCANPNDFVRALFGDGPNSRRTETVELDVDGLGFPPADLERSLAQHGMALEAAGQALADTGEVPSTRTGVYTGLGCDPTGASFGLGSRVAPGAGAPLPGSGLPPWSPASVIGGLANIVSNRISSRYDLTGPSFAVFAEELSGLVALRLGARALQEGSIDLALVGAVDLSCEPVHEAAARSILAAEKQNAGDAAVFLCIKRLADAERSSHHIYAVFDPDDAGAAGPSRSAGFLFGHPHAASGLLQSAAAVLECAHGALAPARPWIVPSDSRRREVRVDALGEASDRAVFAAHRTRAPLPLVLHSPPRIFLHRGQDGSRLAIVARSEDEARRKRARAMEFLNAAGPMQTLAPEGIYYRREPLQGELAFIFPGAASAYHGAADGLLLAFPEIVQTVMGRAPDFASAVSWIFEESARPAAPLEKLAASTLLCQVHARLTLDWLRLQPQATIGFSAGETNTLLAFDVWRDPGIFFSEFIASGVFSTYLSGKFAAVDGVAWETWAVMAPERLLRQILADVPAMRLLAIHAPGEYLLAGPATACAQALAPIEKRNAQRIDFDMVVHCPDIAPFAKTWRSLHDREVFLPAGRPRFYQLATGRHYEPSRDAIAEALTAQASETLDYPRVIETAWNDGVRIFLEHGPRGSCTSWIRKILGEREHLAIPLDLPGEDSLTQLMSAAAQLIAAGIDVDLTRIEERLSLKPAQKKKRSIRLRAHPPPIQLPPAAEPVLRGKVAATSLLQSHITALAAEHARFQQISTQLHQDFLDTSQRAFSRFAAASEQARPRAAEIQRPQGDADVVFSRAQLEMAAGGRISEVYGPEFAELDTFRRICRLPMPPMLLIDRVTRLDAEPRSMKLGVIHTETAIRADSWFLHRDRIPAGLMIEAGQADMLLISWLGIDFLTRGERVYRMLGCDVRFHGPLARSSETLRYEIRITGHAHQGDARLFFFEYDCFVGARLALTVRNGQAGFFSDGELRASTGILWSPEPERKRSQNHSVRGTANLSSRFSAGQILAAAEGRAFECFGEGFEFSAAQQRPPSFARPELLLFDSVEALQSDGGPWGRGYCRAGYTVKPDSWLLTSHFKDDPCLPGTVMLEGSFQLMAFYLMALGLTLDRDGWRFEPVPEENFAIRCRGQVTPESKTVVCEVFVDELVEGAEPILYADVLGTVDGLKSFYGRRLGLKLVPGNPLDASCVELTSWRGETREVAQVNGVPLHYEALLNCAWGLPSRAFGSPYERFDRYQRCPRLPGPPYHCMTRIIRVDGEFGAERMGSKVECDFDLVADAWYFAENGSRELPFSVLVEAGLQPCGWLSCFIGVPLRSSPALYFRNLDGSLKRHRAVPSGPGTITSRVKLLSVARQGTVTLVSFDVQMWFAGELLLAMKTGFGFFTREDLAKQAGLLPNPEERASFSQVSEFQTDLSALPARYFRGRLRLPAGKLLMIDRITGIWRNSIRGSREVRPSDWYFKAHFYQDPVQPGSLGLEGLIQTLQFYAIHHGIGSEFDQPRFQTAVDSVWKYRGQVTPVNRQIETEVKEIAVERLPGRYILHSQGYLWVDGARIYHMPELGLIVADGAAPPAL